MTAATLGSTSMSPTTRQVWTRARGLLLALVVLVAGGIAMAALRSGDEHGRLDPRSSDRYGSRAVAELLKGRGVSTRVVTTLDEATSAAGPDTTLLVAAPDLLTDHQQHTLHTATASSGGRTVLLSAGPASIDALAPGIRTEAPAPVSARTPSAPSPPHAAPAMPTSAVSGTPPRHPMPTAATRAAACPPCSGSTSRTRATQSCSAPPTSSTTTVWTSTATLPSPCNSSAPAPIWSGTSLRSVTAPPLTTAPTAAAAAHSSTWSPPAGPGGLSNSPSPQSWPPSGAPADSVPW